MPTPTEPQTIAEAEEAVRTAIGDYETAKAKEQFARGETTSALNRLNNAQKAFDRLSKALRDETPIDSEWRRADRDRASQPL